MLHLVRSDMVVWQRSEFVLDTFSLALMMFPHTHKDSLEDIGVILHSLFQVFLSCAFLAKIHTEEMCLISWMYLIAEMPFTGRCS